MRSPSKEICPILFIKLLAQDVMHALALSCELSARFDRVDKIRAIYGRSVDWIPMSVSKDLLHVNQFLSADQYLQAKQ